MAQLTAFRSNIRKTKFIQYLAEIILPPIQNVVRTCKKITIIILS